MQKPTIFISHIHKDEQSANTLELILKNALLGGLSVFNSSNRKSISVGDPWREKIIDTIKMAKSVLILASPESVSSPWVNFEAGGAWLASERVIPCCIKGMKPPSLPAPLSHLQAINLESPDDLRLLVKHLAELAELNFPEGFDFEEAAGLLTKSWSKNHKTENKELITFFEKAKRRPEKYKGQSAVGFFRAKSLKATSPYESRQFPQEKLKGGDSLECSLEIESKQYSYEGHCFAKGDVADLLEDAIEGTLLHGRIKCLGQMKVYEGFSDFMMDEDRGVNYPTAWMIVEVAKA